MGLFPHFGSKEEPQPNVLTENPAFVALAQLARDADNDAGRVVRSLVLKPDAERSILLDRVVAQFRTGGAPDELVQALEFLRHAEVVTRLRTLLD